MPERRYIVTGASSGIGKAVSQCLVESGELVVGVARNATRNSIDHPNYFGIDADLENIDSIAAFVVDIKKKFGDIHGAVLCAGRGLFSPLESLSLDDIRASIDLNLIAPIAISKALLPDMKKSGGGSLVFIGSEAALQGAKQASAYCAAKFGLRGFTQSISAESRASGVQVSLINPGMVDTPFYDTLHFRPAVDNGGAISVDTVAQSVLWVVNTPIGDHIEEINLMPQNRVLEFGATQDKE